ncbi:MAG: hypothetical protein CMD02_02500 [Flavobacteriales bacterium]|nr:hypothetical protein [Flavobacteriales bacterium]|tara:strand:+ start:152 stop:3052 length:2901 start_codon:yes stop_codon:yes gene_type:complete
MKRVLLLLFLFSAIIQVNSQTILNANIQGIDCNNSSGYISLTTDISPTFISWYHFDDSGDSTQVNFYSDSLSTIECGKYRVFIYGSTGSITDSKIYFIPCPLGVNPNNHNNIQCFGDSTGSVGRVAFGGVTPYLYEWFKNGVPFQSSNDTLLTNLVAGQYIVKITDSIGCILEDTANVFQPNLLRIDSLIQSTVHCKGTNTGSILVNIKDGKRFDSGNYYDFYLTNTNNDTIRYINRIGQSSNILSDTTPYYVSFDSLGVGNYTLNVVDSFGCALDSLISVTEPNDYELHVSINPTIICEQDSTWLKLDSISGGHSNLEFNWINFFPGDSIYVNSGVYSAIILDLDYNCIDTLDYTLNAPNTIYCDVTSIVAPCFGTNTGKLIVDTIYGGVPPYSIQWGGVNTDSLFAGTYTLFITDSLGCVYMEDFVVEENPDVDLNEIVYPPLCNGDANASISIDISGGTGSLNYFWINASGSPDSVYSLSEGTYYVETSDSLSCVFIDSVKVNDPDDLNVSFGGFINPLTCNGSQTIINSIISGGTAPYSILWSNSEVTSQIVVGAGTYTVDITDVNACSATNSITIIEPEELFVIGSFVPATCNQGASASVTHYGGTDPVSFIWSNGEVTSSASGFTEGDHWVLVTDSCGDTSMYEFTVIDYILETSIYHTNNPQNFAEVEVVNSTVGPPFNYQWYDENMDQIAGETNPLIEDLCEAWYFVTTTDVNNCEVLDSVYAELYFPLGGIVDISTTTVYEDSDLWGSGPYTYLWDNGDVSAHGNICPGFHRVWVTDVNGCEVVEDVIVEDFILTLDPSDFIVECEITNLDVELRVDVTGGTGDYTYLWSSGETENPINLNLNPGIYSVQITDENMCIIDTAFRIAAFTEDCVPNVFTPNGDEVNDVWLLEDAFFYSDSEVRVYNRYGKLVFKSIGYDSPWDGKNETGNDVMDGSYFYIIDLGDEYDKIKGTVSIIR